MMVAQSIRYSKTSVEVVNEKRETKKMRKKRSDFNGTYRMLRRDSKKTQSEEARI